MPDDRNIAGIVLAGGRSSRMGRNKALLEFRGRPMLANMAGILQQTGVGHVLISGQFDGYDCLPDETPFAGPARAINHILQNASGYDGFLFAPVDMPLLTPELLRILLHQPAGGYFRGWPLPAFIAPPCNRSNAASVRDLLDDLGVPSIDLPEMFLSLMKNINTPGEWQEVVRA